MLDIVRENMYNKKQKLFKFYVEKFYLIYLNCTLVYCQNQYETIQHSSVSSVSVDLRQ
jgi:hypothetical protein